MAVEFYIDAARILKPDIVLGPGDFVIGTKVSIKRADKMGDRTTLWIREILAGKERTGRMTVFAPILPVPLEQQKWYLDALADELRDGIEGIYVMDAHSVVDLPETLNQLPRLAFTKPEAPGEVLRQISLGVDMFVLPFIGKATDGGIALGFIFPPPARTDCDTTRRATGIDAWNNELATDFSPLQAGCECYACTKHHRAYLHHLLSAKEMLAWVLLQIHNHHVLDQFFAGVRTSIEKGSFEEDKAAFERFYESELPVSKGLGPRYVTSQCVKECRIVLTNVRIRGYQTKSMSSGESKKNPKAYNNLDHMAKNLENNMADGLTESSTLDAGVEAAELEEHGMGQVEKA